MDSVKARHTAIDIVEVLNGTVANLYRDNLITEKAKETLLLTGVFMIQEFEKLVAPSPGKARR